MEKAGQRRGAADAHAEHEDEQRVEHHVEQAGAGHADRRDAGLALGEEQLGDHLGEHQRHAARVEGPQHIVPAKAGRVFVRTDRVEQGVLHRQQQERKDDDDCRRGIDRKDRKGFGPFTVAPAQLGGDLGVGAHAEHIGDAGNHHQDGKGDGHGRDLICIPGPADKKSVRQVEDQNGQLAERSGQDKLGEHPGNRILRKCLLLPGGSLFGLVFVQNKPSLTNRSVFFIIIRQ